MQSWYLRNFGVYFVVWVWCVRCLPFLPFLCVQPFRHLCILGTFVGAKELKRGCYLRYVYIFRFVVGGAWFDDVGRSGGASDGWVKGELLNNPLKTSVSRLLFCYYLTKCGFLQKSRPLLNSLNRHAAIALTTRSWWTSSASI